jgi:hypothetical protein
MSSQDEMVRLLLSDPDYTIPDIDYSIPKMRQKLIRVRKGITGIQSILNQAASPEENVDLVNHLNEAYPGFKITLIPVALKKLNKILAPGLDGGSKKKKRKNKKTLRRSR